MSDAHASPSAFYQNLAAKNIFACEVCNQIFKQKRSLLEHKSIHTNEKPFSCTGCGQRFRLKRYLTAHLKVCREDGEHVMSRVDIEEDIKLGIEGYDNDNNNGTDETGSVVATESPIIIPQAKKVGAVSGKKFLSSAKLDKHKKIHTAEKVTYKCHLCEYQYLYKKSLLLHVKQAHPARILSSQQQKRLQVKSSSKGQPAASAPQGRKSIHDKRQECNVYMGTRAKSIQRQVVETVSCAPRAKSIQKYTDPTGSRARSMQRVKNAVKTASRARSSQRQHTPVKVPVKGILRNTAAHKTATDPVFSFRPSSVHSAEERQRMKLFGLLRVPNCNIL
eukprot:TRINITY_DN5466_c0_g1_i2.p1 TRINITY_DN5466_c0_g1~~TRINITY_DN5466_c0_g1_i2.p1  ORF type:complete len:334 (+),score=76.97 TRINITY_DN5466_c0_g1_i2:107-1108(+)